MRVTEMAGIGEGGAVCLKDVVRHFKDWRESRVRGKRIPGELWDQAVRMCQEHPPERVAGVLGVALGGLKRRLEHGSDGGAARLGHDTEFLEIIMSTPVASIPDRAASRRELAPAATHECVLELENAHGAKMRVQLNGQGLASLGLVCNSFWSGA